MTTVVQEYIEIDDRGVAKIIGSRSKVKQIVRDIRGGYTPEKIHEEYPHLSMAQIHAALAYYYDHQGQIDAEIEEGYRFADEMRDKNPNRYTREEMEARWRERFPDRPLPTADEPEAP